MVPDARAYMQPELDQPGLQVWLDTVYRRGYASIDAQDLFDSPAAKIVPGSTMYILDPGWRSHRPDTARQSRRRFVRSALA